MEKIFAWAALICLIIFLLSSAVFASAFIVPPFINYCGFKDAAILYAEYGAYSYISSGLFGLLGAGFAFIKSTYWPPEYFEENFFDCLD